jgi:multiple sugar transport system permease protein
MPQPTSRAAAGAILRYGLMLSAAGVMIYPLLWMISSALKPEQDIFTDVRLIPREWSFDNFINGWSALGVTFTTFFANSLIIAGFCVLGNVFACSLTAFAFARLEFRLKKLWFALMLGTLMLPYHVTLIPQYILFLNLDWVDTILPLVVPKYLATDAFFIFLMVQFFRGIPRELDEAAMMDGCSPWRIYRKIILPLSLPVLATAAIFTFIFTWDDFFAPLVYLNDMGSYTVQLGLRAFVDSSGKSDWGALFAMSVLALVPILFFFLFFQRLLIEGVATTGLKR